MSTPDVATTQRGFDQFGTGLGFERDDEKETHDRFVDEFMGAGSGGGRKGAEQYCAGDPPKEPAKESAKPDAPKPEAPKADSKEETLKELRKRVEPRKDGTMTERCAEVDAALTKAVNGGKEEKKAAAEAIQRNFGNIVIKAGDPSFKLLQQAATGGAGDMTAFAAANIMMMNCKGKDVADTGMYATIKLAVTSKDPAIKQAASDMITEMKVMLTERILKSEDEKEKQAMIQIKEFIDLALKKVRKEEAEKAEKGDK